MKVMGLNNDTINEHYYVVRTEDNDFVLLHEDLYEFSYAWTEVEDDIVEEADFVYDFTEDFTKFLVDENDLLEYLYRRGWYKHEHFDLKDFRKFYEGLVKNAFTN